jgi:hypothetical protein
MHQLRTLAAFAAIAVAAACQDTGTAARPDPAARSHPEGIASRAPLHVGWIIGRDGRPMQIWYEVRNGHAIWEGDIDLGPAEGIYRTAEDTRLRKRGGPRLGVAIDGTSYRWPGGLVPYVIPAGFPNPSRITSAITHVESKTGWLRFIPRTTESNYVEFRTSSGCSSSVGRVGSRQYVSLADACSTGNTIHELLHVTGMYHEQSRCDRDTYVTINTANIISGYEHNFIKRCDGATDYGAYWEGSIMHYPPDAFSSNGLPTIVSKRGLDAQMGQRTAMSSVDMSTVNTLYPQGPRYSIFTTQTPESTLDAAPGWEVATRFKTSAPGCVVRLRYYRPAGETGTNTVKLWSDSGTLLASQSFSSGTTGWHYVELRNHGIGPYVDLSICIPTNTYFRVSVNTNTKQAKTFAGLSTPIVNGPVTADGSYYGQPTGSMPTNFSGSTYFVDVVFEANT